MLAPYVLAAVMSAPSGPAPSAVALRPLGDVDRSTLEGLARLLESDLRVSVTILEPEPLPASAFYAPRRRYRAASLVTFLEGTTPREIRHVLGVTARDISITKGTVADWGVFGAANLGGRPAIVSTHRLRAGGASKARVLGRLGRVAVHELAHSLGLPHCDGAHCLMNDAGGSIRSVDTATGFCDRCRKALSSLLT